MKQNKIILILLLCLQLFACKSEKFQGTITYLVYAENIPEEYESSPDKEFKVVYGPNNKCKTIYGNETDQILIIDTSWYRISSKNKTYTSIPRPSSDKITINDNTLKIEGYKCKEVTESDSKFKYYFSDQIPYIPYYPGLEKYQMPGAILKMERDRGPSKMKMGLIATSIVKGKINNEEFEIPNDYEEKKNE